MGQVYNRGVTMHPTNLSWNANQLGQRPPSNLQRNPQWGASPMQTTPDNPYLVPLWWVGLVIVLILIRVLSSKYVR